MAEHGFRIHVEFDHGEIPIIEVDRILSSYLEKSGNKKAKKPRWHNGVLLYP